MVHARYWAMLTMTFEVAVRCLLRARKREAAAVVFGYVTAYHPPALPGSAGWRTDVASTFAEHADGAEWTARGAAMDRDTAIHYALGQLTDADTEPRRA